MEHSQEKLYSDVSNKMFSQKDNLEKHSIVHHKEKLYTCNICNKNFSQRITLDRHSILHTNQKPFSCDLCKKSFYLKYDLNEHYKAHKREKSYSCEICNEKFSKMRHLSQHSAVHANESILADLAHVQASKEKQPKVREKKIKKSKVVKRKKYKIDSAVISKRPIKSTLQIFEQKFEKLDKISEIVDSSGVIESCYNTLHNMCKHAAQFKKHSHRDNLTVLDIQRASCSKISDSCTSNDLIDLKTLVEQADDCIEKEKTFYHGKCLHNLSFDILKAQMPSQNLMNYFNFILQSVFKNNNDLFFYCLADLKRNPYLLPLLPFFIQSICNDMILLKHTPIQLQKFLKVLHSLYQNPNLYFGNKNLYQLIDFTTCCITSNLKLTSISLEDYCDFQKSAAEILRNILSKDCIQLKCVYTYTLSKLEAPIKSLRQKFLSCYGTISAVNIIGLPAILHILQLLFQNSSEKLHELRGIWEEKETNMFQEKLVEACETLLKYYRKDVNLHETSVNQKCLQKTSVNQCASKSGSIVNYDEVPLNIELCNNILNFYGDLLNSCCSYLNYSSNKIAFLKDFFFKCFV